jgi:hypothetical protein
VFCSSKESRVAAGVYFVVAAMLAVIEMKDVSNIPVKGVELNLVLSAGKRKECSLESGGSHK